MLKLIPPCLLEPEEVERAGRAVALETIARVLIWTAESRTYTDRGVRATVMLYCIRPDFIGEKTLEEIGDDIGCSRQAVHKLAKNFRETIGLL